MRTRRGWVQVLVRLTPDFLLSRKLKTITVAETLWEHAIDHVKLRLKACSAQQ